MALSPRDLAARLGIDRLGPAQAAYRAAESARYFARGYRYGRSWPPVTGRPPSARPEAVSPLEAYAEAHREGPGVIKWTHYFDIYDRHLSRFRGQEVHVVEIGVAGGGSLGMWRDYLGPESHIYGVDVDPECKRFEGEQVEVTIGDQADAALWDSFVRGHPRIDVVIDDGGHLPEQQAVTLECLLPHVRPGGVYICEDIHGEFQPFQAYLDGLTRPLSRIDFASQANPSSPLQQQVASVHRYPIMTVIEKASWSRPGFEARRYGTEWPEEWTSAAPAAHNGTPR